jgi:hypothetical protein
MYKIIYLIITIAIIHFVLYYFNVDFNFDFILNLFNKKMIFDTEKHIIKLNDSINELKILNECINNGQINTSFS